MKVNSVKFNNELVSIITPSYNSKLFIKETIKSVIEQTYTKWEMIIVDDCSTDNSKEIISQFVKDDNRIKLFNNKKNIGAAKTRNKAIDFAKGNYIAFLDSDDLWNPEKLELQLAFMVQNKIAFSYTYYDWINEKGKKLRSAIKLPHKVNYSSTIRHNKIGCLTVIFNVDYFKDYKMPNIRKRQDFGLWLKLLGQCEYAYCLPLNLASYRITPNSISSNKFSLIKYHWILYRKIENHSVIKSLYFISYLIFSKVLLKFR